MTKRVGLVFAIGFLAAMTVAATGGQITGGGGLTRVVLTSSSSQIATGSGTTASPLLVAIATGAGLTGTGSAGSPLSAAGGGTVTTSAPVTGTGSGGSPVTLASSNYGDVTVTGGTTWAVNALPESRITNLTTDLGAKEPQQPAPQTPELTWDETQNRLCQLPEEATEQLPARPLGGTSIGSNVEPISHSTGHKNSARAPCCHCLSL